jgi:2-polyprenyl-3-methyl-5-hydroxy-6-metoxy-1,4-benzoquinol methylase
MTCCHHCQATDAHFSRRIATFDLARYRRSGPGVTTRLLIEGLRASDLRDATLLDIGAGIGVLHHELLGTVLRTAMHVEASSAYIAVAREESERRGNGDRVQYMEGDVVDLAPTLGQADVVTLDRVICCYPDWDSLVTTAASKAESVLAFSVPHDRWYIRFVFVVENLFRKLKGDSFRTFVHPVDQMDRALGAMGFRRSSVLLTIAWHVAVYTRDKVHGVAGRGGA